ncbi:DUF6766 family protein [Xylanimonas sp. McL0601]|uniref:DUF6766 family protein n=1 Tax=Xylanimonas sp. McL0601 TaxID=3414739 RepID=UPI003CF51F10
MSTAARPGARGRWRTVLHENALALFFALLLLGALTGQAAAGTAQVNREQLAAGLQTVTVWRYITSSEFGVDVMENWQSEFLQFLLFILATVWLVQRGSSESKALGEQGRGSDADQKVGAYAQPGSPRWARAPGLRRSLYSHSLGLVMGTVFLLTWLGQSMAGTVAYSEGQLRDRADPVTWATYVGLPDFWNRTLQNWQSEFLAVLSMVVFSIYLRERGSPESKPVGAPHDETGTEE